MYVVASCFLTTVALFDDGDGLSFVAGIVLQQAFVWVRLPVAAANGNLVNRAIEVAYTLRVPALAIVTAVIVTGTLRIQVWSESNTVTRDTDDKSCNVPHSPVCATVMSVVVKQEAASSSHRLEYVFPSLPHIGLYISVHRTSHRQ